MKTASSDSILRSGLFIAPIAVFSASVGQALAMSFAFFSMTFCSVLLSALIPRRLPYSLRIVLYSVIGSLVYMPTAILTAWLFPDIGGGIYIPLLSTALYLTAAHDKIFPRKGLLKSMFRNMIPVICAVILSGIVREALGCATFAGRPLRFTPPLPMLQHPAGGLIFLILMLTVIQAFGRGEKQYADRC